MRVVGIALLIGCGGAHASPDALDDAGGSNFCASHPPGTVLCADFDTPLTGLAQFRQSMAGGILREVGGRLSAEVDIRGEAWAAIQPAELPAQFLVQLSIRVDEAYLDCQQPKNGPGIAPTLASIALPATGRSIEITMPVGTEAPGCRLVAGGSGPVVGVWSSMWVRVNPDGVTSNAYGVSVFDCPIPVDLASSPLLRFGLSANPGSPCVASLDDIVVASVQ